ADSGTSNAAAGLPACKLQLRRDSQNQDLFFFEPMDTNSTAAAVRAGVSSRFFLDPEGRQIDELQKWLGLVEDEHRNGRPIPPLIINGLIKCSIYLQVRDHRYSRDSKAKFEQDYGAQPDIK
ncbi:hypothetical protein VOLCADRAFT_101370, partial [Volvox carteri f. nagariensis]